MLQDTLDAIIDGLLVKDKLVRWNAVVREEFRAPEIHSMLDSLREPLPFTLPIEEHTLVKAEASSPVTSYVTISNTFVSYNKIGSYAVTSGSVDNHVYVHVPSFVKVHRAPFSSFGPNLFGLAYTSTGDVHIRDDLHGSEFSEVLLHEVLHQTYPNCSEQQVRQFVVSILGSDATIHQRIGPGS